MNVVVLCHIYDETVLIIKLSHFSDSIALVVQSGILADRLSQAKMKENEKKS